VHTLDYMSRAEPGGRQTLSLLERIAGGLFAASSPGRPKGPPEDASALALRQQARLCRRVLGLFHGGVLVLDEVDLILHPLRSELNWPLGGKVPLDFTTERQAPGMRWVLPFHALDPFFFAAGGECVMEVLATSQPSVTTPLNHTCNHTCNHACNHTCNHTCNHACTHL
jgi:hypothetical protein